MSFLDSVLSSLNSDKSVSVPTSRPESPASYSTPKLEPRNPGTGSLRDGHTGAGMKRKADDQLQRQPNPGNRIPGGTTTSKASATSTFAKSRPKPTAATTAKPTPNNSTLSAQKSNAAPAKAPPRGSFADLMARAKDVQQKAPTNVGMLKHQISPKERLNKTERKKRALEARAREKDARSGKRADLSSKVRGAAPTGRREPGEQSYRGTSRATQPSQPAYRGTAGLPRRVDSKDRKPQTGRRSRMDDYLGTDEEDEGDYAGDYDDYYSESSDMEAGLDDVEEEEAVALKSAQREDEKEWQAELAAKREKMERRKKLTALASRRK